MKKIVVFLLILYTVACSKKDLNIFSAGSYAFAERYIINNTEQDLILNLNLNVGLKIVVLTDVESLLMYK